MGMRDGGMNVSEMDHGGVEGRLCGRAEALITFSACKLKSLFQKDGNGKSYITCMFQP